ncbi:SusC/RagA family TonB-linked outer membrane protein [Sphingobacterium chuzhouense]|uniref:TonB-dependent receptor n=1 Tax=Sphingobacterium chuzhouense TaxID=1742264 RepID=A0ABR7XUS2_9SPHI|nr:TonB-dependent receptor [Sphingobacterium chuzhouense]MBD1422800.1 TonB-dependent receptor [Sphingobacterium chuzhouense]
MRRKIYLTCILLFFALAKIGFAAGETAKLRWTPESIQQRLKGRVVNDLGQPISGVTVSAKDGRSLGVTNQEGIFEIAGVNIGDTLSFSYIGYVPNEMLISNFETLQVVMTSQQGNIDEVVVVGYGTQRRSEMTGSISSVKSSDLEKVAAPSFTSAIQGKVPGVTINQTTGAPGGASSVRIRGVGTTGGNQPLYVIDGFPVGGSNIAINGSTDNIDGMSIVNPNDIESIEILKDAAAASIYGARAANGVILITTKRGKEGVTSADLHAYTGFQNLWRQPKFLNAEQFATLANELYQNSNMATNPEWENPSSFGQGTNWIDEVFRTAPMYNVDLSLTGGNQKIRNALSLGYRDQQGTLMETWNKRYTGRANVDLTATDRLNFGGSLAFSYIQGKGQRNEDFRLGIFNLAQQFYPTLGREDVVSGSSAFYSTQGDNPYLRAKSMENYLNNLRLYGNAFGEFEIMEGLKFKSSIGLDFLSNRGTTWEPKVQRGFYSNPQAVLSERQEQGLNWLIENTLSYNKTFDRHNLSLIVGQTAQKNTNDWISITAREFQNETIRVINTSSESERRGTGTGSMYTLASYLGRANYSFDNKYLFSASIRRDGSSNFGPSYKWGNFPSISAGWNISEESFFNADGAINSLKVRASWGQLGNDAIGAFGYSSTFGLGRVADNYILGTDQRLITGAGMIRPGNSDLKWETSEQWNFGVDATFLNGGGYLTAEYYVKDTRDMLVSLPVSLEAGFESAPSVNGGRIRNSGFELLVGYGGGNEFQYDVSVNLSTLKNEVLSLGAGNPISGPVVGFTSMNSSYTEVGLPIGYFRGYVVEGIYQSDEEVDKTFQPNASAGDFKFRDVNGDNVLSDEDRVMLGSPWPKLTYGMNIDLSYKNFDLNLMFQGVSGNDIFHVNKFSTYPIKYFGGSGVINASADVLDRWTSENGGNTVPILKYTDLNGNYANLSSFYIEDGSYLRLRNFTLGYTLPQGLFENTNMLKRLRVYTSIQNLFTFTKYSGFDPEIGDTNPLASGVDNGVYPMPRTYMFGVKVGF